MNSPDANGVASAAPSASEPGAGADQNTDASRTPSASSSPSVRITSDIPSVSSAHPPPVTSLEHATPPISLRNAAASPKPSPAFHGHGQGHGPGIGIRTAGPSNGATPGHSPALVSPSVMSPQHVPAGTQPPSQPMASSVGQWQVQPTPSQPIKPPTPTHARASMHSFPIVDPAAPVTADRRGNATAPSGFPSPGQDHMQSNPKFNDDRARITHGIQQSIPDAVRRAVRDNWGKCLLGSDFHQAFVLNASIHHATPAAIRRGMRDFGKAMISAAKHDIINQMTPDDLDHLADQILAKASNSFLDKALALRIKTIEAVPLINALARAERLGYESSDVVDEDILRGGSVAQPVQQQHALPGAGPPTTQAPPVSQPALPSAPFHCLLCFRKFNYQSSYEHHVKGKVCTRSPNSPGGFKFSCQHCGQGFANVVGLQYHNANKVCGDFGEPVKVSRNTPPVPVSTPAASRVLGPVPAPVTPAVVKSTPKAPNSAGLQNSTPSVRTPSSAAADPYAHLSPEQLMAMQQELRSAEIKYSERMRQAHMIPVETERKQRLDGLANSFGTKQSLIRKKYGVRLRMRRTKAEIQSERDRMQYRTAAELVADLGNAGAVNGPGRPISSGPPRPHASTGGGTSWTTANKRAAEKQASTAGVLASSLPVPGFGVEVRPETMDVTMHSGNKRRFSSSTDTKSPNHKRVAYSQMGGLSGATAAAETKDPTLGPSRFDTTSKFGKGSGSVNEPMALDDSDNSGSEDSGEDEDIPAQLPPSVRQSLQRSSPAAMGGENSRPGSSSTK